MTKPFLLFLFIFVSCESVKERDDFTDIHSKPITLGLDEYLPSKDRNKISIVSWNVNNFPNKNFSIDPATLEDTLRINLLAEAMLKTDADVYALQEVKSQDALSKLLVKLGTNKWFGQGDFRTIQGRCIIVKKSKVKVLNSRLILREENGSNYIFARRLPYESTLLLNKKDTLRLINVHLKAFTDDQSIIRRRKSIQYLKNYLDVHKSKKYILLGDFNEELGRNNVFDAFTSDISNYRFSDASIIKNGGLFFSYPHSAYNSHIDHVIINRRVFADIDTTYTLRYDLADFKYKKYISDHRPIFIQLKKNLVN